MDEVSGLSFSADARKGKKGRHDQSDRGFFGGTFRGTHPRCAHLDEHTCLTAPAMFMQVMVAILIGGWAR